MKYIQQQVKLINEAIEFYLRQPNNGKFFEASRYTIGPEGHRYRSLVGLEIYKMLQGNPSNFMKSIVGIECIHHASLIFDDLPCMDNSPMRKGKPTTHIQYGEDIAILAGLHLWETGRQLLYENSREHLSNLKLIDEVESIIHKTIVGMLVGQELDLKENKTDEELFNSIYQKNRMFHLICVLPAYLLKQKKYLTQLNEIGKILDEIGINLSVSYQLFDDLRDIERNPIETGKPVHVDKGKRTSVYRYGVEEVKQQIGERKQKIIEKIREIQENSRLEKIIEHILSIPS